jgi:hypothetical protein
MGIIFSILAVAGLVIALVYTLKAALSLSVTIVAFPVVFAQELKNNSKLLYAWLFAMFSFALLFSVIYFTS